MYFTGNHEGKVLEHIQIAKKGTQLGYGPATNIMRSDNFVIHLQGENRDMSPYHLPIEDADTLKDFLKQSKETELADLNAKDSFSNVFSGTQGIRDYLDTKIKKANGQDPFQKIEEKYERLSNNIEKIEDLYQIRQEEELENEKRQNVLDEIKQEVGSFEDDLKPKNNQTLKNSNNGNYARTLEEIDQEMNQPEPHKPRPAPKYGQSTPRLK